MEKRLFGADALPLKQGHELVNTTDKENPVTWKVDHLLGSGNWSFVYLCTNMNTKQKAAIKVVNKLLTKEKEDQAIISNEVKLQKMLSNTQYVCKQYEYFETEQFHCTISESFILGTLQSMLDKRKYLTELEVQFYGQILIRLILSMEKLLVMHREFKLANFVLNQNMELRLIDFGCSVQFETPYQRRYSVTGEIYYQAPEMILQQGYNLTDINNWQLGCFLFTLLTGQRPFDAQDKDTRMTAIKIKNDEVDFTQKCCERLSQDAVEILKKLLVKDPQKRMSLEEAMHEPFFLKNKIPKMLPTYCLTEAPKQDFLQAHLSEEEVKEQKRKKKKEEKEEQKDQNAKDKNDKAGQKLKPMALKKKKVQEAEVEEKKETKKTHKRRKSTMQVSLQNALRNKLGQMQDNSKIHKQPTKKQSGEVITVPKRKETGEVFPVPIRQGTGDVTSVNEDDINLQRQRIQQQVEANQVKNILNKNNSVEMIRASIDLQADERVRKVSSVGKLKPIDDSDLNERIKGLNSKTPQISSNQKKKTDFESGQKLGETMKLPLVLDGYVLVKKWVDYSSKYGIGYIMSEGSAGVHFNDQSKVVTQQGSRTFTLIKPNGETQQFDFSDEMPEDVQKKCHLLKNFRTYLAKKDKCLCSNIPDSHILPVRQGSLYIRKWMKNKSATIFCFNNRSTQVYFKDKSEFLLDYQTQEVIYVDKQGQVQKLNKEKAGEIQDLTKRLKFVKETLAKEKRPTKETKEIVKPIEDSKEEDMVEEQKVESTNSQNQQQPQTPTVKRRQPTQKSTVNQQFQEKQASTQQVEAKPEQIAQKKPNLLAEAINKIKEVQKQKLQQEQQQQQADQDKKGGTSEAKQQSLSLTDKLKKGIGNFFNFTKEQVSTKKEEDFVDLEDYDVHKKVEQHNRKKLKIVQNQHDNQ